MGSLLLFEMVVLFLDIFEIMWISSCVIVYMYYYKEIC